MELKAQKKGESFKNLGATYAKHALLIIFNNVIVLCLLKDLKKKICVLYDGYRCLYSLLNEMS